MNKFINKLILSLAIVGSVIGLSFTTTAQNYDEPIITFKTKIYENNGELNQFSIVIGTVDSCNYVDVDCGFGKVEYVVDPSNFNADTQEIDGTLIDCKVSSEGIVKIYGDATKIDYFNASGCYISWIEFPTLTNMSILDLSHNELERLDLSHMTKLASLNLSDNTFTAETPLIVGANKPKLNILELSIIEHLDQSFNISDYPELVSFDGYHNRGLKKLDPTGCPELLRLTLDVTDVETLDVSKNTKLMILNISDTRISDIDVSKNPYLTQFYCSHRGSINNEYKLTSLDVTNNPELVYLFCAGNKLTSIDISKCPKLVTISATDNYLTSIDVSNNPELYIVELDQNCLDFATLPFDPGVWNTYYYGQRNFEIEKSYLQGTTLDFSSRVLREGTTTEVALYAVSEESPESPTLLDENFYTYADGKITLTKTYEDSVYVAFANSAFPEAILRTNKFMVKDADNYGKPTKVFYFTTSILPGNEVSFSVGAQGATKENPVEFLVNFGDGTQKTFTATTDTPPSIANVTGTKAGYGAIEVFAPEGVMITAIETKNITMYNADVTAMAGLRHLHLINAGLYDIDLSMNRCLRSIDLSGSNLYSLTLEGNGSYTKNVLSNINLSNNKLSSLILNDMRAIRNLNISNNQLSELDLSYGDYVEHINISHNTFTELDLTYCASLKSLDVSYNSLPSITMPETNVLEYFACNNNLFTLETLPAHGNLPEASYIYAPQADYQIATKGPGADLSSQNRIINGVGTSYVWKTQSGNTLVEGVDYTIENGITKFLNIEAGNIYCEMTNPAYPAFSGNKIYKTTIIEAAGMPTYLVASFKTVNDGDAVSLSLAAAKSNTGIYFDWNGDNNVTQYLLSDTYRLFSAETKANTTVNVYTYEADDYITVFSMTGAALSSFDGSKLTNAINISVNGAGLSEITLPKSTVLSEISLDDNNFSSFDLSEYSSLETIALNGNKLTSIDLSKNPNLGVVSISNNQLTEITLNNEYIWALYLSGNKLSEINLDGVPNVSQLDLSYNQLSQLNVANLSQLRVMSLINNYFTFNTLPLNNNYAVYYYNNQAAINVTPIDGVVDLSSQALVDGEATTYRWFVGAPEFNDEGVLEGEELIIDTEYTIENGVTTFLKSIENVMCVMTNAKFPDLYLYTNLMNVVSGGVEGIEIDQDNSPVKYYNLQGIEVDSNNLSNGIYIKVQGNNTTKVYVK